ncbi:MULTISPECIES: hypothetical protein [unclassified Nocardioides]|uniref:hypothetical protein n=1 Tax=unclassified Nocardioides TaxID=2615069 RepID=UPI00138ED5B1|nr:MULTISPECIES: hypothetical protein [unclassified Nocardioides]
MDRDQVDWAVERQRQRGGQVGQHLIDAGLISAEDFHAALARAWRHGRRDLVAAPPHPALLAEIDVERAVELGWLACELTDDGRVVVASAVPPTEDLVVEVLEVFPDREVGFVACTQHDLDRVALDVRLNRIGDRASGSVPGPVRPVHWCLAVAGALLAAVGALVLPLGALGVVLLVASVVFLVGGVIQAATGYTLLAEDARTAHRLPEGSPGDEEADRDLPLYTVIVRVGGGAAGLEELFDNFRAVDYPRERTDAILVVARGDTATVGALRGTNPRGWVRVARVPDADFLDVVRACDHALALARGRYVVAYDQDERPAPDQLRRAVAVFEADLAARLEGRLAPSPLVGLRVERTVSPGGPGADVVLHVAGAGGPLRSSDVTSVHFNMRLLRRYGGFGLLLDRRGRSAAGEPPLRVETLDSWSTRAAQARDRHWMAHRADVLERELAETVATLRRGSPSWPALREIVAGTGSVALVLSYPVVLGGGLVAALRSTVLDGSLAERAARVALGEVALVVAIATVVAASVLVRRRGWRAGLDAVALPALWVLDGFAAWAAVHALLHRAVARRG